jgi:Amt family ammonium transporter
MLSQQWATFFKDTVANRVWGTRGWQHNLGTLDFAGGTVVHITSGASALVAAVVLGRRKGFPKLESFDPHDLTMVVLGAGMLWFGWFGFNAGSALTSGGLAASAFVVTNTAAAMAALTWMSVSWMVHKRPSVLGAAAGAVAGLVAITPASGFVTVPASILIGLGAGVICFFAIHLIKERFGVDDALDVVGVHGVGGTFGALATGVFATVAVNSAGANGLVYGNPQQLVTQLIAVSASWVYSVVMTFIILKAVDAMVGVRVPESEEVLGLDTTQHGEIAYQL